MPTTCRRSGTGIAECRIGPGHPLGVTRHTRRAARGDTIGGLSQLGGAAAGVVGGGVIGKFFHKGLKMTEDDAARISSELDADHAAVGVLAWDFEADAVADKLRTLGGTHGPTR